MRHEPFQRNAFVQLWRPPLTLIPSPAPAKAIELAISPDALMQVKSTKVPLETGRRPVSDAMERFP
jgi:hypothetical protein